MKKILSYIITIVVLSAPGLASAQRDIAIPNSAGINAIDNQFGHSRSNQEFDAKNNGSNELYTIIEDNELETGKNADTTQKGDNVSIGETGKNAGSAQSGLESERSQNGSETDKNVGVSGSSNESSKNSHDDGASNKEREQNDAAHHDTGDSKNNDNKSNDESDKNSEDSSEKQNAENNRGTEEQPAPDDTAGGSRSHAGKATGLIESKRDYTTPSEKAKSSATKRGNRAPSRTIGKKTMLDHTAGDGTGSVDPNQTGNKPAIGAQPGGAVDPKAFDNGNLTGKGLGQPDSAPATH